MRANLTRERLGDLMKELARSAPPKKSFHVYFVGGATAVQAGWRASSIDADLYSPQEEVFRDIQAIKERLEVNVDFARPEDFVPALAGSEERHVFVDTVGTVHFYHYDPYAQLLSKVVRGFARDLDDARNLVRSGMVEPERFRSLVWEIPDSSYARYPSLTRAGVQEAIDEFLAGTD